MCSGISGPEDFFILTNSVDPDEMPHFMAFHLGLLCLLKHPLMGLQYTKGFRY